MQFDPDAGRQFVAQREALDWSPFSHDESWLLVQRVRTLESGDTAMDVSCLSLDADGPREEPIFQGVGAMAGDRVQLSSDDRWIAFTQTASGRRQVLQKERQKS